MTAALGRNGYEVRVSGDGRVERTNGRRLAVYLNGRLTPAEADPSPLFEVVGALMKLFETARAVVESRVKPPYGVEAAGLHIDVARGVVAEYVVRDKDGEVPVRIVYSPEPEEAK